MIRLTDNQLKQCSDFTSNLGVVLAAAVLTPLFSDAQSVNVLNVLLGFATSAICLTASLYILGGIRRR